MPNTAALPNITWHAARDGVGHAVPSPRRRGARTLCGQPVHDPRFDWNVMTRCAACQTKLIAPETQLEIRAGNGDR